MAVYLRRRQNWRLNASLKTRAKIIFFVMFGLSLTLFSSYHIAFYNKIIPFVVVGGETLGNLTEEEAYEKLKFLNSTDTQVVFNINSAKEGGKTRFVVKASDIAFSFDVQKIIDDAFSVGRSSNFINDLFVKSHTFFFPYQIDASYTYNRDLLDAVVESLETEVNSGFNNAYFYLNNGNIYLEKESSGLRLDDVKFRKMLLTALESGESRPSLEAPMVLFRPDITEKDLAGLEDRVQRIVFSPPVLTYGKETYRIAPYEVLKSIYYKKDSISGSVDIGLSYETLLGIVGKIGDFVNATPKGEVELDGEKVVSFRVTKPGKIVDEKVLIERLITAILEGGREVKIPIIETDHPVEGGDFGIKELIGRGSSKFEGSSAGRIHNIKTASLYLDGTIVAPGKDFSFNKSVGPIDREHGYTTSYIIEKGRTVLGTGGGVCQVSTTMFRAALNAGLAIVERVPHAYRVSYYEQDSLPGLDATIYQPSVDFVFKNDTDNYILIKTNFDEAKKSLSFDIYGTDDGREVAMTEPQITSEVRPPQPLYEETDSLPKGVVRQVDWSAWGATTKFSRKVTKEGKILSDDTFISNFRPWRAVYLVGTAE